MLRADRIALIFEAFNELYPEEGLSVAICLYMEASKERKFGTDEQATANNYYQQQMSYSQEVTLKLTVKGTIKELKTVLTGKELNKLLDTKEGRATLMDQGRFAITEITRARTLDASPDAIVVD